jgi:hypothetical protein
LINNNYRSRCGKILRSEEEKKRKRKVKEVVNKEPTSTASLRVGYSKEQNWTGSTYQARGHTATRRENNTGPHTDKKTTAETKRTLPPTAYNTNPAETHAAAMPPPTESKILTSFLIPPSPLPVILPPTAFAALFPPSTPPASIAHLYRLLSHQRALLSDAVKSDIEDEAKRGVAQRRAVVKNRRAQERGEDDEEERIELAVSIFFFRWHHLYCLPPMNPLLHKNKQLTHTSCQTPTPPLFHIPATTRSALSFPPSTRPLMTSELKSPFSSSKQRHCSLVSGIQLVD